MVKPPEGFGGEGRGVHLMSMASSENERRSILSNWVVSGLHDGEGFAYAEPDEAPASGSIMAALTGTGVDVDRAHQDGWLLRIPMTEFYAVNAPAKLAARARAQGFRRLRIATDARRGLQVLDAPTYLEYERGLADTCSTSPLSALCQFGGEAAATWLSEVSRVHTGYGPTSAFLALPDGDDTLALFGEVDISNDDQMTEALRLATDRANGFLRVDLSGLTLLSAAGCRAMIESTDNYRARGGHVLLVGARPPVHHVLRLLGFDQAPGFTMAMDSA